MLPRINHITDPETAIRDISDAHVHSLVPFFQVYVFNHARRTLSVKTTAAASSFKKSNAAPSATPLVLAKAASKVLLNEEHWIQALRYLQKAGDAACDEAPLLDRCVTRRNGRPIAKMEADKLRNLANKVNSIVRCDCSFVAVVKLVISFSAAIEKKNGV